MGENYAICLIGAMDRLWFHEIVLFSEPTSLIPPQAIDRSVPVPVSESLTYQSSIMSIPEDEEILSPPSSITSQQVYNNNSLSETHSSFKDDSDSEKGSKQRRRSTGFNGITSGFGSHSSLTMAQNRAANLRNSCSLTRLQKSMSCKSLSELEVEEVKGFMDLGFKFGQSQLSPRMMSVLPGLQRLGCHMNEEEDGGVKGDEVEKNDDEIEEEREEEKRLSVMRPYLSEAWLIKRPDSPLLNLRVPRVYAAADMKKHLKYWARTVASVIHQES